MLVTEAFQSLKENIKGKITNPFFGTLIVVWIIRNFDFVYAIFNMPTKVPLEKKLWWVNNFLEVGFSPKEIVICVVEAIVVLFLSYLLLNLSRFIVRIYKPLTNWIDWYTDKSSMVPKDEHLELVQGMESKYNNQLEQYNQLKASNSALQDQYDSMLRKITEERKTKLKETIERSSKGKSLSDRTKEKTDSDQTQAPVIISEKINKAKLDDIWLQPLLKDKELISNFNEMAVLILKKQYFAVNNEKVDNLLLKNLVKTKEVLDDYNIELQFTDRGEVLRNYLLNLDTVIEPQDSFEAPALGEGGMFAPPKDVED